jgi:hypothetical protein
MDHDRNTVRWCGLDSYGSGQDVCTVYKLGELYK